MSGFFSLLAISLSAVFFVVDPLAAVPIFISITAGDSQQKIRKAAARACLVGCGILLFFALFGGLVFKVFGVTLDAFRVAGGILLLMTSLDMLRARRSETRTSPRATREGTSKEDVAIVPLAMPLLAGPGSIATVTVLMSKGTGVLSAIPVLISIVVTFAASYLILRAAGLVHRILKQTGIAILERLMGLILSAIAVQFIAEGSRDLFKGG